MKPCSVEMAWFVSWVFRTRYKQCVRITFITVVVGKGHMRWTGLFLLDINSCDTFHTACTSF